MWKLKTGEGGLWLTTTNDHVGRQYWEFDPGAGTPEERAEVERLRAEFTKNRFRVKQSSDLLMKLQLTKENRSGPIPAPSKVKETEEITKEAVTNTLRRALIYFSMQQSHNGFWPAENAGPLFFLPPLVLILYVMGSVDQVLGPEYKKEIIRYAYNHQNEDGGWGFHILGPSTMFGTALNYIALRLLGEGLDGDESAMARARQWILNHGGLVAIPSWGKFWVAVLGLYEWSGCNPVPPEMLLLPKSFPFYPGNMLCYCRLVYIPMAYLYGRKFVGPKTDLIQSLRKELHTEPYDQIDWNRARNTLAKEDVYYPHPLAQDILWGFLHHVAEPIANRWPFTKMREKALKLAMEHIHYEDENSRYFCIGCVEKLLCMLAVWVEDPKSEANKFHLGRIPDYLWIAEDGLKFQSFGSQMWDVGFIIQAYLSSNLIEEFLPTLRRAHDFVKASQVCQNPSGDFAKMGRHISKGAWTFSTQDHGWQVSDCTGEGLKVSLLFSLMPTELVGEKIETQRFYDAVNVILSLQSKNGGFPAWESQRTFSWVEKF
ncbi:lupeol synthase, partial [Morus notabilis]|uniref:lupeol synthase n=1 Tax=Morus notabilis TaxID=981085 RepID=UPI000CED4C23